MATLIRDSFDPYLNTVEASQVWTSISNCTMSATTRFAAGQSLQLMTSALNGTVEAQHLFAATGNTLWFNFALRKGGAIGGAATSEHRVLVLDGATVQCSFTFDNNGGIRVFRGNAATLLGTYAGAFPGGGVWNHFQVKIVIDNAVGSFEIRRDGSDFNDFEVLNVDTQSSATAQATNFQITCGTNNPESFQIDDFWLFDNTVVAGEPSDWIGDSRANQIVPNSDSAAAMSRSAGATNFSNVDELINSAADYVFSSTPGQADEYGNAGFSVPVPDVILGLTVRLAALKTDAGPRTVGTRVRSGATVTDSPGRTVGTTALQYQFRQDLNPNTGAAWTAAEIAAMTFGPRIVT